VRARKAGEHGVEGSRRAKRGGCDRVALPAGGATPQYLVDGQDRRFGKKKNGVFERAWLYRNQLNPVAELDGSGALVSRFVYGSKSNVPEYMVRGGVTYRVLSDHLGSPRALVNVASGAVAWRADFDAWGNRTLIAGAADFLPFGFAGGMLDADTGLTRFGARDYDPVVGRWTARDPIRFVAFETSAYQFVHADPVNLIDRAGRGPEATAPIWWLLLEKAAEQVGKLVLFGPFAICVGGSLVMTSDTPLENDKPKPPPGYREPARCDRIGGNPAPVPPGAFPQMCVYKCPGMSGTHSFWTDQGCPDHIPLP